MPVTRDDVLRFRVHAQELASDGDRGDAAILDLGVQETGPDGAGWALAIRGARPDPAATVLAWTIRGAPHLHRRAQVAKVAAAVAPWSDTDAAKRIFDAAKPFKAAGIPVLDALDVIAAEMRDIVRRPTTKGALSAALTERLDGPYLRRCQPCDAIHLFEQPFRLSALRAGLELEPATSPPVLRRIPRWRGPGARVPADLDVVRGVLRFLGPADPTLVAGYLDAPVAEVAAHWPDDVVEVEVDGARRSVLAADEAALADPPDPAGTVRLLGPFDLFLQGRDRPLVVPDAAARKDLWRTLGRPGAILDGHQVVGTWRPRTSGDRLRLAVDLWGASSPPAGLDEQAERLAAHRDRTFAGYT